MLTKKKNCLAWVRVRRGACEMGMPEHGGPQAAAFARACKSSPPPSLFNLLSSQARAFFYILFVSVPAPAERTGRSSLDAGGGAVVEVESTGEEAARAPSPARERLRVAPFSFCV